MAKVPVPSRKSIVIESQEGYGIIFPTKKSIFIIIFLGFWMIGWAFGEITVSLQLIKGFKGSNGGPELFLIFWLCMWTLGGGAAIFAWLWMMFGQEHVLLNPASLIIKRTLLGFAINKEYDINNVKNMRVSPQPFNAFDFSAGLRFWGIGGGLIAFDYGSKTIRFGPSIEEAEAYTIVKEFSSKHKF
jgi:hypothetical protein